MGVLLDLNMGVFLRNSFSPFGDALFDEVGKEEK